MSLSTINDRLDLVEEIIDHPQLRQDVIALLGQTFDSLRLVTKFTYGRGDADDLMELSKTIATTSDLVNILRQHTASRNAIPLSSNNEASETRRRLCMSALERRFDLGGYVSFQSAYKMLSMKTHSLNIIVLRMSRLRRCPSWLKMS